MEPKPKPPPPPDEEIENAKRALDNIARSVERYDPDQFQKELKMWNEIVHPQKAEEK